MLVIYYDFLITIICLFFLQITMSKQQIEKHSMILRQRTTTSSKMTETEQ